NESAIRGSDAPSQTKIEEEETERKRKEESRMEEEESLASKGAEGRRASR
uniref:Uncharacterized protein n=1 Tax=Caenorhabditis japonica TaxID=281687 RepID=A0A8R1EBE3_CAEJA